MKNAFGVFSKLLIESEVNGRLISTFKLASPIVFRDWKIDVIEVPAPKKGKITIEGFEHLEVVSDLTFDELKKRYQGHRFDDSGLRKSFNKELEFNFEKFAVKFHHLSLESVINIEANRAVFSALRASQVLELLQPFHPLVAGTFPLNLHGADSDLDILVSGDIALIKTALLENFGDQLDFRCSESLIDGEPSLIANFTHLDIKFEIFGQKTPSLRQTAYLHFLVEERLLKLGGPTFSLDVLGARSTGLKTEPAFSKVLGITDEPYAALLSLQKQSNRDLVKLLSASHRS